MMSQQEGTQPLYHKTGSQVFVYSTSFMPCWNKGETSKQLTVDMSGCNNWTLTHTYGQPSHRSAHREEALMQQRTTTLRALKVELRSCLESTTVCLVSAKWMRSACEHFIYMYVQVLMICTFISIYFCCKVSPVSAVLWGYIKVMHLLRCKCTGVKKTCLCFINAI